MLSPAPPLPLTRPIPDTRLPNSGDGGCGLAGGTGATYLLRGSGEGGGARGASAERGRLVLHDVESRDAHAPLLNTHTIVGKDALDTLPLHLRGMRVCIFHDNRVGGSQQGYGACQVELPTSPSADF